MADGNYKVSLGVDLRVNEIRERINQYNANSNNAKLRLGVRLDTKGLAEQIRAINYKTPVKLAIKFDTKSVQSQISNIRRQIQQLGNIRINLGGSGIGGGTGRQDIQTVRIARSVDDVTRAYRELLSLQSRIGSKQQAVAKLDTSKNQQEILELSNQVDKLYARYQRLHTLFNGQFSSVQTDRLNRGFEITAEKLEVIKSKALDAKSSLDRMGASGTKAGAANSVKQTANELTIAFNKLRNISQNIGVIKSKLAGGLNTSKDVQQIKVLEAQLQSLTTQYHNTVAKIKGKGDLSTAQWQTIQHQIDNTKLKLDQLSAKVVDAKNKLANNIKLKLSDGTFANDISNIQAKFNGLSMKSDTLRAGIDRVKLAIKDMQTAANSGNVDALTSAYQRYQVTLKSVENQLRINKNIEQQANNAESLKQSRNAFLLETNNWLQKNSAAAAQFGGRIKELQAQVNNCDKASLARLRAEFSNIKQEAALAGKTTQTFGDRLRMQFQRYSAYFSVASVIMYSVQALRSMFEQVKAIDSAMVELKKVTNETNESYNEFLTNAAARSKEIGTTIDGLVQSTAGFARLGYGFEESQKLAEVANIYAVVGDEVEGVEGATKSLISTMAAFKEQQNGIANEDFAMDIIDKFNEIGNNFAISSGGIGDALQRSASSLAAANNTLDESIALITAANTVVQNPEVVGTAFKTMSMRIRGAKSELEEAGLETEGMVESTAKLRQEILALSGVDIMEDNDTFKSTYKILDELAVKWKDLTDIQQASITELIAGKRQGNVVSSLMTNFDTAREALETSANSEGSAMAEHEKWMQSLEAGLNRVKAAWQSLSQSFLKSDFLKSLLKSVESLTSGFGSLIDTFGTLPTILTLLTGGKFLISGKGFFKPVIDEATGAAKGITTIFGQAANNVKTSLGSINVNNGFMKTLSQDDIAAVKNYSNAVYNQGVPAAKAFATHMGGASNAAKAYVQNTNGATISVNGFVQSQQAAEVSTLAQNKSIGSARALMQEYHSGCKASGMAQTDFANAVKQTNPQLAAAMTNTNNVRAGMFKYTTSLVGAKVATLALKVTTMALNMALTMGVSFIVSELMSAITKWINAEEELAERVDEVTSKFKEQHKELQKLKGSYDASNPDSTASKYAKLSKGVDNLGRNVSLTTDEYSEYQSIVNKIADQIPSLVSGYDSQGNAILSVKGNVEELTKAYEKLIHAQNQDILTNAGDIEEDFQNTLNKKDNIGFWESIGHSSTIIDWFMEDDLKTSHVKMLESYLNNPDKYIYMTSADAEAIKNAAEKAGLDTSDYLYQDSHQFLQNLVNQDPLKVQNIINDYYAQFSDDIERQKTIAQAKLSEAFDIRSAISGLDYGNIGEDLQAVIRQTVNNLDFEFFEDLKENGKTVEQWTTEMLEQLNAISKEDNAQIEASFDLQTKFNGGDISFGEYVKGLENTGELIEGLNLDKELESQLKLSLGLNEEGLVEEYETLINRLTATSKDNISKGNIIGLGVEEAKKFVDGLSAEELSVVTDVIPELDANATAQQIQAAIDREMAVRGLFFDLNLEVETASIDAFNTALQESVSAAGLSADSIAALKGRYADLESEGYNLSDMFEETSNGIHLNRKAVRELEKAYAEQKQNDIKEDVNALKKEYDLLTQDINKCNDASERASLYVQRDAILKQINDAATLAAQYEGLTSAYNDWLAAEESGQERDMYEKLIEGFENVDDEISRGWLDDGTIEFLELLTGRDLTTAPIEDLKQAYADLDKQIGKSGYSIRDFFTVNDDGDSTNAGVYNFLETIESLGGKYKDSIKRKDGRIVGFDFKIAGGDEAIAKALGISEELVEIMLRASDDAGFVVNLEGAWTQLADLKTEAESARDKLIDLKKNGLDKLKDSDVNFDLNAEGKDLLAEQEKAVNLLEKFKKNGKIDLTMDGAQQALDIAEYLTIRLDDLTEPRYMQVDASILDDNLKEPVEKMQEFERLSKQKHLLSLTGDTKGLEEVNAEMDEIAEYLYQLDDEEVKTKLDIEGLDTDEIKKKLEAGEIELPAELNLDVKMSDDLKDMRLMMMNQLGLVSDNEVKLKIGYEIDDSIVNKLTDGEQEVVVKYLVEHKEVENYTPEQKNALVKYLVEYGDVTQWSPETKESFVKYFVDENELQNWSPEAKTAFVKYLVDGGDPENFDPENKDSWVVYHTNDTEVQEYQPPDKTMTVWAQIKKKASDLWSSVFGGGNDTETAASGADGTAHVNGTTGKAFKQGSWGTKNSGTALVGELGRETLVRDGRYYTIGDSGAEFIKYRKGDIIFNHRQTEELFANGKVTSGGGRGKAFANGTAFAFGSSGIGGGLGKIIHSVTVDGTSGKAKTKTETKVVGSSGDGGALDKNSNSTSKDSGGGSSKDEFEETFDWIEVAISRIERAIDQLDQKANNIYKSWSDRNSALTKEIGKVREEIELQEDAAQRYLQEANSVGLDSSYAEKVRHGTINIEDFKGEKNEKLVEKIKDYQTWYEKYLDCIDAAEELRETEAKLYAQRVENVQTQYDGILSVIEHEKNILDEYIAQNEANAQLVSVNYYNALAKNERENLSKLEEQKAKMLAEMQVAMDSGTITKESEAWYDMVASIDEVTLAIAESNTQLIEYQQTIQQLSWERFDLLQEKISSVVEETEFLIELMSSDKLYDDNGKLTNSGMATMGQHGVAYNTHMYQAELASAEAERLKKELAKDPFDTELEERYREMVSLQQEHILAAQGEKEAIRDMVEEGINLELDALQERIDKYNEAIDSQKDLYDYQKKVKEQTKEIASLEKQMASYGGNDSEEAKAKIQELKVSLEEAKSNLEESEYDKRISDQQQLLDELYLSYEEILNTRLDNLDALVSDMIVEINTSASSISTTLSEKADSVGYTLSDSMDTIWDANSTKINGVIADYGSKFMTGQTTTNNALNTINTNLQNVINQLNSIAKTNIKSASTSSVAKPQKTNTTTTTTTQTKPKATTAATIKVGGKINAGNAKIYDYAGAPAETQYFKKDPVYKVLKTDGNWLQVRWHKLTSGVTGWFKKSDVKALATGAKRIDTNDMAWTQEKGREYIVRPSDGAILTPVAKGDSVLNATASGNIWNMANSPAEFIRDNLKLSAANVPNNSNVQNVYSQHLDKVVFNFPNVKNYEEMLAAMQRDKRFERLVLSISVDRIAGKSSLAKGKSIRN